MADNRIAYGLAKKYGIDTKGLSPKEVWDALKEKGVTQQNAEEKYSSDGMGGEHEPTEAESKRLREIGIKDGNALNEIKFPERAYGFFNKKLRNSPDHIRHAKEMGYKNQNEYEMAAIEFWDNYNAKIFYGAKRNRFAKYDYNTGKFVVVDKDGTIKTFYILSQKQFEKKKKQEVFEEWIK